MENRKRPPGLSIMIIILLFSNVAGIFKLWVKAEALAQIFTFVTADQVMWLAAIPVLTIVSLAGLWQGRRWGIWLALMIYLVVLSLDLAYRVWAHAILASVMFLLLFFFIWRGKGYFGYK